MKRDFDNSLRISEIFYSIQGESTTVGLPTVFIRLTGCPLRCVYCDSEYAFYGGNILTIQDVILKTQQLFKTSDTSYKNITITGGEPLAQKACINLIRDLCEHGYNVSIETSGAFEVNNLHPNTMIVMDIKTPDSNESAKNLWTNIQYLKITDQIKFVICSQNDYEWAKQQVLSKGLYKVCEILFSPSYHQMDIRQLAENILADNLPVRLQMQLHKYIWGEEQGR